MIDQDARQYDIASLPRLYQTTTWVDELWKAVEMEACFRIETGHHGYLELTGLHFERSLIAKDPRRQEWCTIKMQFQPARQFYEVE